MVNARDLADHLGIDRATVSAAIGDLETGGQLRRRKNTHRMGLMVEIIDSQ